MSTMGMFGDVETGHSTTAAHSDPFPSSGELQLGEQYRVRLTLAGPYDSSTPGKIANMVATGAGLNNDLASQHLILKSVVRIDKVVVGQPTEQAAFKWSVFTVDIYMTKTGGGTPMLLLLGIVLAIVLAAVGMLFIVTHRETFHEVRGALSNDLPKLAGSLVAPLLAVGLVVYFVFRR